MSAFLSLTQMVKTQKSKLIQSFTFTTLDASDLNHYTAVIDMGFFWRLCIPTSEDREKGDETNFTWYDYAQKMFSCILHRHSNASSVVFVNDPYDVQDSIKAEEHANRSYVHGSKNVFIEPSDDLPNKSNMSKFFANKSNKIRLQNFLEKVFRNLSASYPGKDFIYSVQRNCRNLRNGEDLPSYKCSHQEADTIIFFIIHTLRRLGNNNTVVIDSEDTDVVVLSSLVSHRENGVLGMRRKKATFDCTKFCSQELSSIIVKLHVLTGSDCTSGFFGRGKKAVVKTVLKNM